MLKMLMFAFSFVLFAGAFVADEAMAHGLTASHWQIEFALDKGYSCDRTFGDFGIIEVAHCEEHVADRQAEADRQAASADSTAAQHRDDILHFGTLYTHFPKRWGGEVSYTRAERFVEQHAEHVPGLLEWLDSLYWDIMHRPLSQIIEWYVNRNQIQVE